MQPREAWLGSTTALTSPQAVGLAVTAEQRQPLHTESQLGSVTGPSGPQAVGPASPGNRIKAPSERCLLGNFQQPKPS